MRYNSNIWRPKNIPTIHKSTPIQLPLTRIPFLGQQNLQGNYFFNNSRSRNILNEEHYNVNISPEYEDERFLL